MAGSQANHKDVEEPYIDVGSSGRNSSLNSFKTLQPENISCATICLPSGQVFQLKTGENLKEKKAEPENIYEIKKSDHVVDKKKFENVGDVKKSENVGDEKKSKNIGDEKKSENVGDEKRSESEGDEKKSENVGDMKKSENVGREMKSEHVERLMADDPLCNIPQFGSTKQIDGEAAESKASTFEKKVQVTVPDPLIFEELQKAKKEIIRLRNQNSDEKTIHENAIRRKNEEISNLRDQLKARADQKADVKSAPSIELTKQEINFIKMKMIQLYILTDVLYYLLKDYKPNLCPRIKCDITYLYKEYRGLNSRLRKGIQNTGIGDDIESIRYIRNKLDHSVAFHLSNKQFKDLCKIIRPILRRFDQHIRPSELYTVRLDKILKQTFWMRH